MGLHLDCVAGSSSKSACATCHGICSDLDGTYGRALVCSLQDVHDRALLYYRLLKVGPEVAKKVIDPVKQPVSAFADTVASEVKDRIFDEFNTLSVVYGKVRGLLLSLPAPLSLSVSFSLAFLKA